MPTENSHFHLVKSFTCPEGETGCDPLSAKTHCFPNAPFKIEQSKFALIQNLQ